MALGLVIVAGPVTILFWIIFCTIGANAYRSFTFVALFCTLVFIAFHEFGLHVTVGLPIMKIIALANVFPGFS